MFHNKSVLFMPFYDELLQKEDDKTEELLQMEKTLLTTAFEFLYEELLWNSLNSTNLW